MQTLYIKQLSLINLVLSFLDVQRQTNLKMHIEVILLEIISICEPNFV